MRKISIKHIPLSWRVITIGKRGDTSGKWKYHSKLQSNNGK